jgi:hypothetical protein
LVPWGRERAPRRSKARGRCPGLERRRPGALGQGTRVLLRAYHRPPRPPCRRRRGGSRRRGGAGREPAGRGELRLGIA